MNGACNDTLNCTMFVISVLITVCVRYKQLDTFWSSQDAATKFPKTNNVALVMGVLAALGLSIVANFQVGRRT